MMMNKPWMRIGLCFLALFILLGCSLEEIYLGFYIDGKSEDLKVSAGIDTTPVVFTIESGQSVQEIAGNLKALGLIGDTELFRRYVQYKGLDSEIQAGSYSLNQTMTIPEIARTLQQGDTTEQQVTIPEGKRMEEVAAMIAEQTNITQEAFLQLAQTGWTGTDLPQKYPILANVPVTATLEGFLYPDTYRLPLNATPYDLVDRMIANFAVHVTPEIQQSMAAHNLTLYQCVTLAAIVEREAVRAEERPAIAGVYYNRLRDGWPLSADPTVQYALGYRADEQTWWKRQLYFVDLDVVSPYNTYRNLGLPPAPIASPGIASIQAAAQPAETEFYFFMVDCSKNDGSHVFSLNEAEHLENFNRCNGGN